MYFSHLLQISADVYEKLLGEDISKLQLTLIAADGKSPMEASLAIDGCFEPGSIWF